MLFKVMQICINISNLYDDENQTKGLHVFDET